MRSASLLASVAESLPAWQGFDPLPLLAAKKREKKVGVDNDNEKSDTDCQENRIHRLFNPIDSSDEF